MPDTDQRNKLRGKRKLYALLSTSGFLFLGFAFAAWCKAPTELFSAYVGGLAAASGFFIYGNVKTHQAGTQLPEQNQQNQTT
jgi:hypothetical protein